jgi:hypothetical protein
VIINSESKRCHPAIDCDLHLVSPFQDSGTPHFIKGIFCPLRSELPIGEVWFTELGKSQLAKAAMGSNHDFSLTKSEVA